MPANLANSPQATGRVLPEGESCSTDQAEVDELWRCSAHSRDDKSFLSSELTKNDLSLSRG